MVEETVAAGWAANAGDVKPPEAAVERLREAFYSGAFAGHMLTLTALFGDVTVGVERLEAIRAELLGERGK